MTASFYLQYGCGHCAPSGWLNFDASPTLVAERIPVLGRFLRKNANRFPANVRYGNIARGLPIPENSCQAIYCSHILEHLSLAEAERALEQTYRYLAPGGIFRCVLPDLRQLCEAYLADPAPDAGHKFMQSSFLGTSHRRRSLTGFVLDWLGNSRHLWMWDYKSLAAKLGEHGFREIRPATFGDSEDPRFREVEDAARFEGCLAIQCRK